MMAWAMESAVTGPSIDNRVSIGNIIVLATMLVSVAINWGHLTGRQNATAAEVAANKAALAAHEARIRAIENSSARHDERLLLILDSVRKIEAKLEGRAP